MYKIIILLISSLLTTLAFSGDTLSNWEYLDSNFEKIINNEKMAKRYKDANQKLITSLSKEKCINYDEEEVPKSHCDHLKDIHESIKKISQLVESRERVVNVYCGVVNIRLKVSTNTFQTHRTIKPFVDCLNKHRNQTVKNQKTQLLLESYFKPKAFVMKSLPKTAKIIFMEYPNKEEKKSMAFAEKRVDEYRTLKSKDDRKVARRRKKNSKKFKLCKRYKANTLKYKKQVISLAQKTKQTDSLNQLRKIRKKISKSNTAYSGNYNKFFDRCLGFYKSTYNIDELSLIF